TQGRHLPVVAFDRGGAVLDEEELVAGLALLDEHLSRLHLDLVGGLAELLQILSRAGGEQGDLRQVVEVDVSRPHGRNLTSASRSTTDRGTRLTWARLFTGAKRIRNVRLLLSAPWKLLYSAGRSPPDGRPRRPVRWCREPREPEPGGMAGRGAGSQRARCARAAPAAAREPAGPRHPHRALARVPPRSGSPSGPRGLARRVGV